MSCWIVIPALMIDYDVVEAFGKGFVNPFITGYSIDVICCGLILLCVIYDYAKVRYGWVCLLLGIVPRVAVGFTLFIFLKMKQTGRT